MEGKKYVWGEETHDEGVDAVIQINAASNEPNYDIFENCILNVGAISYIKPFLNIKTTFKGTIIKMVDGTNFYMSIDHGEFTEKFLNKVKVLFYLNRM